MKQSILFIDRDGTIIEETKDKQIDTLNKLSFLPDVLYYLRKLKNETNFLFVMVTNQDGLGTDSFPEKYFFPIHRLILRILKSEQIIFDDIHIDTHFEWENHPNRKPNMGMLHQYMKGNHDLENSYVIGDRVSDIVLANNLGSKSIYLHPRDSSQANFTAKNWGEIYEFLIRQTRSHGIPQSINNNERLKKTN